MSQRLDYNQLAPAGIKALGGVYGYVSQTSLSPVLVDLVYLRVSQINNCAFCLDMHTRDLIKKGVPASRRLPGYTWKRGRSKIACRPPSRPPRRAAIWTSLTFSYMPPALRSRSVQTFRPQRFVKPAARRFKSMAHKSRACRSPSFRRWPAIRSPWRPSCRARGSSTRWKLSPRTCLPTAS